MVRVIGSGKMNKVIRGGSWLRTMRKHISASRDFVVVANRSRHIGFRVVMGDINES